jgi:D-serine deaminase-like pyridoxal phosphate-dependent protein
VRRAYPRHSQAPVSRKKGFSKTRLAAHLTEAGIGYRHLRGRGTPQRGRDAARAGDVESFERIFLAMDEPEALLDSARR